LLICGGGGTVLLVRFLERWTRFVAVFLPVIIICWVALFFAGPTIVVGSFDKTIEWLKKEKKP
jgi:uncharacterized SAM-binding protein YcdF (DUF218 family)